MLILGIKSIIITELVTPSGVVADHLVDDILEVQCELLDCQVLTLWTRAGGELHHCHPRRCPRSCPLASPPPTPTWTTACSRMGRRLRPRRSVTTKGREILSSSNSEGAGQGGRDGSGRPGGSQGQPPMLGALPTRGAPHSPSSGSVPSPDPST